MPMYTSGSFSLGQTCGTVLLNDCKSRRKVKKGESGANHLDINIFMTSLSLFLGSLLSLSITMLFSLSLLQFYYLSCYSIISLYYQVLYSLFNLSLLLFNSFLISHTQTCTFSNADTIADAPPIWQRAGNVSHLYDYFSSFFLVFSCCCRCLPFLRTFLVKTIPTHLHIYLPV